MKKCLSLLLAVWFGLSAMLSVPLTGIAADDSQVLAPNIATAVTFDPNQERQLRLTVPEDGYYQLVYQDTVQGVKRACMAWAPDIDGAQNRNFEQADLLLTFPAEAGDTYTVAFTNSEVVAFTYILTLEKHTHLNQKTTVTQVPTCTQQGNLQRTCADCSCVSNEAIAVDPTNHPQDINPVCKACGQDKADSNLQLDQVVQLPYQEKDTYRFYRFCPSEDGVYYFIGGAGEREKIALTILDEDGNKLEGETVNLTGGHTYHLAVLAQTEISGSVQTTIVVRAHTHSMVLVQQYAQTCVQDGYTLYRCRTCGAEEKRNFKPATGVHRYDNCVCSVCGQIDPDSIQRISLALDQSYTVTARYCREKVFFTFTPTKTDYYLFSVDVPAPGKATQLRMELREDQNLLQYVANKIVKLKAGTAYQVTAYFYSSNANEYCGDYTVCLQRHEHDYQFTSYREPTCCADGEKIYTCAACKDQTSIVIPHTADSHYYNNQGICTGCGQKDPLLDAAPVDAVLDAVYTVENSGGHHTYSYVFTPASAGYYQFLADGDFTLYSKNGEKIAVHANGKAEYYAYLEAGEQIRATLHTANYGTLRLEIHAHTHSFSERTISPTCGSEGYVLSYCNLCGYGQYQSFLPATNAHVFTKTVVQPTCVAVGYTSYTCKNCGFAYKADYKQPDVQRHTDDAADGVCTRCGYAFYQPQDVGIIRTNDSVEVTLTGQQVAYAFVPEADGVYSFEVLSPYATSVQRAILDNRNQAIASGTQNFYAYCQKGYTYRFCCAFINAESRQVALTIVPHTHAYEKKQTVQVTCTQDGYTEEKCTCGDTHIVNFQKKTGKHNMDWDDQRASCGRAGYHRYRCQDCGYVEKKTTYPATGDHNYRYGECRTCGQKQYPRQYAPSGALTLEQPAVIENLGEVENCGYSYTFTPTESGYYQFAMHGNRQAEILLTGGGLNCQNRSKADALIAALKAGTTYTVQVWPAPYSGSCVAALTVSLHTHALLEETVLPTCGRGGYTRENCTMCAYTQVTNRQPATEQHTFVNGYCTGCNSSIAPDAVTGTVSIGTTCAVQPGITNRIAFTPTADGVYAFYSISDFAPKATVRDSGNNNLSRTFAAGFKNLQFDSPAKEKNFAVAAELKKGVTYYLVTKSALHGYQVGVTATVAHDYTLTQRHKNSCEKVTYDVYTCSLCGQKMAVDNTVDHQEELTKLIPPTYDQDAKGEFTCLRCGEKSVHATTPCKSHAYIDEEQPATDMLPKCTIHYCKKCGEVGYRKSRCREHKMEVDTQEATCAAPGYVKTYCVRCGYCTKKEIIPQLQHQYQVEKYAPSCTQDGYKRRVCTMCMKTEYYDKKPKLGHKWGSAKVVRKATYAAAGKKRYTCNRCGATKDANIPKRTVGQVTGISVQGQKKGLLVKWKRGGDVTGYRIQYSTDSKFSTKKTKSVTVKSAKTTKKTISKLAGKKKYYVRVRAYKTEKGKTYNSAWSKTYTVKTK